MTEQEQRDFVVAEAKTWIGTPYAHQQMVKGAGVDCGMILVAVYRAAGLLPPEFLPDEYPPDWYMHRDEPVFESYVRTFGREITLDQVRPGDVGLWKYGRSHAHGAIFVGPGLVVHAVRSARKVILSDSTRDVDLINAPVKYFSPWGK